MSIASFTDNFLVKILQAIKQHDFVLLWSMKKCFHTILLDKYFEKVKYFLNPSINLR